MTSADPQMVFLRDFGIVGCVAPDLNNVLSGIVNYPALLLMGLMIIAAEALMHGRAVGVSTHP